MWRRPIYATLARLRRDAIVRYPSETAKQAELSQLHALIRKEIYRNDAHAEAALVGLQTLLETRIARIGERSTVDPRQEIVERALHRIEAHLATGNRWCGSPISWVCHLRRCNTFVVSVSARR